MERCIVLVDAGYLLGAAASLVAGDSSRARIAVDHTAIIGALRERAEQETGQPLLRIYWFDGAPDRVPQPEHRRLRVMPRVTVRLGALTRSNGRTVQKGVDAAMHAELSELARNRACSSVVLVTGDGDLLPGVVTAKSYGVEVHLWAVQAADGAYNQSEDLVAEADERRVLDRQWIKLSVSAREAPNYAAPAHRPEIAAILSAPSPESRPGDASARPLPRPEPGDIPATTGQRPRDDTPVTEATKAAVPTPKDLARPTPQVPAASEAASTLCWSSDGGMIVAPSDDKTLPTLEQVTTDAQRWQDREEDMTTVAGDSFEVGQVFGRRWALRTEPGQRELLAGVYPRIPRHIDGELLRYAARFGLLAHKDDHIDEGDRFSVREGFWNKINDPAGAVPASH